MDENPYAAPQTDFGKKPVVPFSGTVASPFGPYQDISVLKKVLLGLLALLGLAGIADIYALAQLNDANRLPYDDPTADDRYDRAWELADTIETGSWVIFIAIVVVWCLWKRKSCKNAWAFQYHRKGRDAVSSSVITPGWAVGGYFIPLFHLYKPYQAMAFIRDAVSLRALASRLLPLWWFSWLLMGNVGWIFLLLIGKIHLVSTEELETEDLILYNQSLMIDSAFTLFSCLIAGLMIHQLSDAQKNVARELGLASQEVHLN